jgi:hypothetical protein
MSRLAPDGSGQEALRAYRDDLVLDGKPFETTRLPVKPLLNDDPGKAFALVQGRAVGPGELAAGSHTFSVTVENDPDPEFAETYTDTSKFFVDPAGTGA